MTRVQFIQRLRELGFTDDCIREVLALRRRERQQGIKRRYVDYLPKE